MASQQGATNEHNSSSPDHTENTDVDEELGGQLEQVELSVPLPPTSGAQSPSEDDVNIKKYIINHKNSKQAVLIVNIYKYDHMDDRQGSEEDVNNLKTLITETLEYQCGSEIDYDGDDKEASAIKSRIRAFLKGIEHGAFDSVMLFIMGHGVELGICDSKYNPEQKNDANILKYRDVIDLFSADEYPHLQAKPRLIVFASCRGKKSLDNAVKTEADTGGEHMEPEGLQQFNPLHADVLVVYSSIFGHVSYRNEDTGTLFIQMFCRAVKQFYDTEHLLDIVTQVTYLVAKAGKDQIQLSNTSSTLRRRWYLQSPPAMVP